MSGRGVGIRFIMVGLVTVLVAAFAIAAMAAQTSDQDETTTTEQATSPGQEKHIATAVSETGATRERIEALRADGAGWGVIRHGAALADAENITLEAAIEKIRNGEVEGRPPWAGPKDRGARPNGQAKKAEAFAAQAGVSIETIEEARAAGAGWGQIRKAAALVEADGMSFAVALESVRAQDEAEEEPNS